MASLPDPVIPVLMRALQRSPAERYVNAEEMAEAFQGLWDYFTTHPSSEYIPAEPDLEGEILKEVTPGAQRRTPAPFIPTPPPGVRTPKPASFGLPESPPAKEPEGRAPTPFIPTPFVPAPSAGGKAPTPAHPHETAPSARESPEPKAPPARRGSSEGTEGPSVSPSTRRPSPASGPPQKMERDASLRPPPRVSTRTPEPSFPMPKPSTPTHEPTEGRPSPYPSSPPVSPSARRPAAPVTPVSPAPSTEGLPPRLPRTVTALAVLPEMPLIPGGVYRMGGDQNEDERPVHPCSVDPFYMATHPVTNEEYRCFVLAEGHPPPRPQTDQYAIWDGTRFPHELARRPVVHISWDDAVAYCRWLSEMTGGRFRLPTEAEWERAARGGLEDKLYPWGDEEPLGRVAFDMLWTGPTIIPEVCSFTPNGFGLYDMSGLVWEWCRDFYHRRYYELPEATEPNPVNEAPAIQRVQRGGAWLTGARTLRCAYRGKHRPDSATVGFGFRIVREP